MVNDLELNLTGILAKGEIDNPKYESRLIIQFVMDCSKEDLLLDRVIPTPEQADRCRTLAKTRAENYPLQYILGKWEFYGHSLQIGKGVLIPRPETELLCDLAIERIGNTAATVLDLCAGSGCIAIAVQKACPHATVIPVELSETAADYCKKNMEAHQLTPLVIQADVLDEATEARCPKADFILCNPPYLTEEELKNCQKELRFEPAMALNGGPDGLRYYREILRIFKKVLKPGGSFIFEIGAAQADVLRNLAKEAGYPPPAVYQDYSGNDRVVIVSKMNLQHADS